MNQLYICLHRHRLLGNGQHNSHWLLLKVIKRTSCMLSTMSEKRSIGVSYNLVETALIDIPTKQKLGTAIDLPWDNALWLKIR